MRAGDVLIESSEDARPVPVVVREGRRRVRGFLDSLPGDPVAIGCGWVVVTGPYFPGGRSVRAESVELEGT